MRSKACASLAGGADNDKRRNPETERPKAAAGNSAIPYREHVSYNDSLPALGFHL